MRELKVSIKEEKFSYPIIIGDGVLDRLGKLMVEYYNGDKILLLSDKNVFSFYGDKIVSSMEHQGYQVIDYVVNPGEGSKSYSNLIKGYNILVENNFNRDNMIVALGGGVVGDLAGFLASTFMRGISFIQIPTSLLAQVDSSVGGKTAINHPAGKNLIGSFYQPRSVIIDPAILKTLPERELISGLAEVIKYGLISDREFIYFLKNNKEKVFNLEPETLISIIYTSCSIKAKIVSEDEKERGIRALLNYGHTIGHALEVVTGYKRYKHGEAVAVGMYAAAKISSRLSFIDKDELDMVRDILKLYHLPVSFQYDEGIKEVYDALFYDKKILNNKLRWVLLERIGKAFIEENVDEEIILKVLEGLT